MFNFRAGSVYTRCVYIIITVPLFRKSSVTLFLRLRYLGFD